MRKKGVDISLEYLVSPNHDGPADLTDPGLAGWSNAAARLKRALEKDDFALYCQPILDLRAGAATRFPLGEVLVRMREEEQAMLPPGEFLPILEHYRMMPQLDRWVVRHLAKRLALGTGLPVYSMNLSGQTIDDPDFPGYVAGIAKAAALKPGTLVFEVEEQELISRQPQVAALGSALHAAGGVLLIDGYGRKSVSFAPLKALRPGFVKVEGSIVRKLLKSTLARTKLEAILRVAEPLDVCVIAECVEEPEILERLRAMGIPCAQGFGIAKPQPIEAVRASPSG
jgi:EAL domain-containing protein (putative c-di-GMP-specific phosphodiesterase class I)